MKKLKQRIKKYYQEYDFIECKNYILENCQKEYQEIFSSVEAMMNQTFVFNDQWDMEPCSTPYTIKPMCWDKTYNEDKEWIFMLNRHEYLDKFIIVYMVEEDIKYINKLKEYIFDWIQSVQILEPTRPTTRTLDTGIRCFAWLEVMMLMVSFDVIEDQEIQTILTSLEQQIQYLKQQYIDKYTLSNWGILQTTAMIACVTVLQDSIDCKQEYEFAKEELQRQIEMQILEDGSQWEQSIMYHVEVYKSLLKLVLIDPQYQEVFFPVLNNMVTYIQSLTGIDNKQIATGDSDFTDTRDILTLSAIVLKREDITAYALDRVTIETILLLGNKAIKTYASLPKQRVQMQSHHFKDSGQVTIRYKDSYIYFKNGPMSSGHSHSDENSMCLYYQGKPIFIDPGRYTYKDSDMRYYLKSGYSHSSCIIDNTPPEIIKGSWDYGRYPQPIHTELNSKENCFYIEGSLLATTKENSSYLHKRKIVMIENSIWVVVDDIVCSGTHMVSTGFILDSKVQYKDGKINRLQICSEDPFYVKETKISKKYNELENSSKIIKEKKFKDRTQSYTVFMDDSMTMIKHNIYQVNKDTPLSHSQAYEFKNDKSNYLIVMIHDEIHTGNKICMVDGIKVRGKCIIYDKNNKKMIRLKN